MSKIQNIDVRFNATSNFGKVKADLVALQAEAAALGDVFRSSAYAKSPALVDPVAWQKATRAVDVASNTYRNAASSSGMFTTQQIRATSEAEKYTKALQKQKLAFGDMVKHRNIMREVYRDQLRYQRMTAQYWGTDSAGRAVTDIAIPKSVPRDLDNMRRQMGMFGNMAASAGTQVINLGKNIQWAGRQLTVGFTYPVALFGAAAGVMAFKVEDAFAKINKVYDVSAAALTNEALRTKELNQLRTDSMKMATEVAKEYGLTIEKTLAVEQELAATGLRGKNLMDSTREVQRISALGDIDPEQTTAMVVALQTAFRGTIKDGDDLTNTLNFMNAASNATSLSLQDIAEATPRAASGLAQLGVNAQEMTIMLVSMREAGVDAAEGANALKSATTRLLNDTIVAKATKKYKEFGAAIDVKKIVQESGGNLYKFLGTLGKAVNAQKDLTAEQKASAIAALFGTYQFNRLNAALVNIGDAQSGVNNQTAKAIELQKMSTKELANMAENSRKAMVENPAGKFKQEWANFQIQLAEMGQPFLEVATMALKMFGALAAGFNDMPGWQKKAIMLGVGIMAVAGPTIMLAGLFANLFGQFVKGAGVLAKFIGISTLVTKEEQAAALTTEAANKAMAKQTTTTAALSQEIQVLAAAYNRATFAAKQYAVSQGIGTASMVGNSQAVKPGMAGFIGPTTPTIGGKGIASPYTMTPAEARAFEKTQARQSGKFRPNAERLAEARRMVAEEQKAANIAQQRERIERRTAAVVSSTSMSMALGTASAATMMFSTNETANNIAKLVLIGTVVVPAMKAFAMWSANAAKSAWSTAAGYAAAAKASAGGGIGLKGGLKAGGKGLGAGLVGLMGGPVGIALTGIAAVGVGLYALHKKSQQYVKEQLEDQRALTKTTQDWADALGVAARERKKFSFTSYEGGPSAGGKSLFDMADEFSKTSGGKGLIKSYGNAKSDSERETIAMGQYLNILRETNATADDARRGLEVLFVAAGDGALEASQKAKKLYDELGNLDNSDLSMLWSRQLNDLKSGIGEEAGTVGTQMGKILGDAMYNALQNGEDPGQLLDNMRESILSGWSGIIKDMSASSQDMLSNMGINVFNIRAFVDEWKKVVNQEMTKEDFANKFNINMFNADGSENAAFSQLSAELTRLASGNSDAAKLRDAEAGITNELAKQLGIARQINTLAELRATWEYKLATATKGNANELYAERLKEMQRIQEFGSKIPFSGMDSKMSDDQKLIILNQIRIALGLKEAKSLTEGFKGEMADAKNTADGLADSVDRIPSAKHIKITLSQSASAIQSGMSSVQDAMADSAMNKFNSGWDARIDAANAANDRASKALDDRMSARKDGLQAFYEKRINAIKATIDAEKKADETRQRLFDKEKERLQRLADMQNKQTDYAQAITEGRLDDAAKIANDMQAKTASDAMDDEQKAAEARSERRQAALEKQIDRLEKRRDKASKGLDRAQERMRANLAANQAAQMSALEAQRKAEEKSLQDRLSLFKAFVPKNMKELNYWMKQTGISYDMFGNDIKLKGKDWSESIKKMLFDKTREAGLKIASDEMWKKIGSSMTEKMLAGMGFPGGLAQFNLFLATGKKGKGAASVSGETRHEGGIVGSGSGSRKGVPNTYKGLHRSEKMIRAQKGEYVVNRKDSAKNTALLDAINSGTDMGGIGAAEPMAIGLAKMFQVGTSKAFQSAVDQVKAAKKSAAAGPGAFSGNAGNYGGTTWSAEQMKNAAIIASVGAGMGMSQRDLMIGIMTSITESGLRNINYGDRDSVGLFQQRTSQGWGTIEQIMNPRYSSGKFFSVLKGHTERGSESPWLAAQHVQRSAFADGSNYAKWWGAAQAIFNKGLSRSKSGSYSPSSGTAGGVAGYVAGAGGKHRPINGPVTGGLHGGSTAGNPPAVDMAGPTGRPVYAVSDGVITSSRDIAGPLPTDRYRGDGPYGSFGRVIQMRTNSGASVLYAHLSRRGVSTGQQVRGGSIIGYSGNTGNSSGPHLHFGATNGPYAWLRKGGQIRYDNTPAILHKGETVLTSALTRQFKENVASGGGDRYDITVDLRGAAIHEDVDIEKAVEAAFEKRARKVGHSRKVN